MLKWLTVLVIIIIAGLALWWFGVFGNTPTQSSTPDQTQVSTTTGGTAATSSDQGSLPTSASDTSNASINTDVQAIDQQMNGLQTDSTNVNSSVNAAGSSQ